MSTSKVFSAIPFGIDGHLIAVECDTNRGLPAFNVVGLPSRPINESRQRIRSALKNSGFSFPTHKLTINLAPAELPKAGTHLDLAISIAILVASGQLLQSDLIDKAFVGELSLSGEIRPIRGIISVIEAAKRNHVKELYIPAANATQASLVATGIKLFPVQNLRELWQQLKSIAHIFPLKHIVKNTATDSRPALTLDQIADQPEAKRAIIIAVAGRHNLLLSGPPGVGKSMLAQVAHSLLPPPDLEQRIELTKIHSLITNNDQIIATAPFRAPPHTTRPAALIGSVVGPSPGEITLAHHGILFLDELPEFSRQSIESLRAPLEAKQITLRHLSTKIIYPADFILIAAMNPCPCGYFGTAIKNCSCRPAAITNYQNKLSGPILDRIDMTVKLNPVNTSVLLKNTTISTHEDTSAKRQILHARIAQSARYQSNHLFNGTLSAASITQKLKLSSSAQNLLNSASSRLQLSARAYFKTIKVAQTIADLDQSPIIDDAQIAEALRYRQLS